VRIKFLVLILGALIAIVATYVGDNTLSMVETDIATTTAKRDTIKTVELNEETDYSAASHGDAAAAYLFYLASIAANRRGLASLYETVALDESDAIQRAERAAGISIMNRVELLTSVNDVSNGNAKAFYGMQRIYHLAVNNFGKHIVNQNAEASVLSNKISDLDAKLQKYRLDISLLQILGIIVALFKDVVPDVTAKSTSR
jgi:hypothetical protein